MVNLHGTDFAITRNRLKKKRAGNIWTAIKSYNHFSLRSFFFRHLKQTHSTRGTVHTRVPTPEGACAERRGSIWRRVVVVLQVSKRPAPTTPRATAGPRGHVTGRRSG